MQAQGKRSGLKVSHNTSTSGCWVNIWRGRVKVYFINSQGRGILTVHRSVLSKEDWGVINNAYTDFKRRYGYG